MERFDPGRYDTAWPTRVHAARLQVDFFLNPRQHACKNAASLVLPSYGYFVYRQKAFILEVQLKLKVS